MKKFITLLATVLTVASLSFSTVFAAGSTTGVVEVTGATDGSGSSVAVTEVETSVPLITTVIAGGISGDAPAQLEVLWQRDLTAASLPVSITFNANGTDGKTLYVFHYNSASSSWELITSGTGPSITATFTDLSPVALVVKTEGGSSAGGSTSGSTTSPVTGDTNIIAIAGSVILLSLAAGAVVVNKNKK